MNSQLLVLLLEHSGVSQFADWLMKIVQLFKHELFALANITITKMQT